MGFGLGNGSNVDTNVNQTTTFLQAYSLKTNQKVRVNMWFKTDR